ncbi:hypothetical protein [Hydrogenophaga crocea]|uniref:Uncharacterized protein n=1 Tax=Hydrogenophaga crocea TaxID=2716225 RepID=A0A6G8II47_9BURK|nr:hypothetical protein [Hydrogenophaga crocea]QIM52874.1 hypothetical protein G9Q37_12330 [Hydrogenophaga crocea]
MSKIDATHPDNAGTPIGAALPPAGAQPDNAPSGARTLYARPGHEPAQTPPDARTQARRDRLLTHAQGHAARRQALAELLRSGALADVVQVDPLLRRDVDKLMAFVLDDDAAASAAHPASN